MPPICVVECPKCETEFYFDKTIHDKGRDEEVLCPNCLQRFKWKDGLKLQTLWQAPGQG